MLTHEENELMCRVGPGTPMGEFIREYWIPAFLTSELPEPDGAPLRARLLGENLIAFHTTSGKYGLMQNACPHRGASMFFGRNEEDGLRCVYHGWKFDTAGNCIDMPNEPAESNFKHKIRAAAYPCVEVGGIVWAYMGPRETPPSMYDFPALKEPNLQVGVRLQECSYMQALEGDIDTVHAFFLHAGHQKHEGTLPGSPDYYSTRTRDARFVVRPMELGATYAAIRPAEDGFEYWRMGHYLLPFWTMNAPGLLGVKNNCTAWVPLDDENTLIWSIGVNQRGLDPNTEGVGGLKAGVNRDDPAGKNDPYGRGARNLGLAGRKFLPDTSGWLGRWRPLANKDNDYLIDRDLQKTATYSGIPQPAQDPMAQESMGPIYDRTKERLGTTDGMIIQTRRKLIGAARAHREGTPAPGVDRPELYHMRGGGAIVPVGVDGIEGLADLHYDRVTLAAFKAGGGVKAR